ncbi:UDP-2,4-diacetamido-2,4,6-trideoxy-beta-L-altropyranose hydrolase [Pseudomonas soli]|uniref:UDP-2,4-diacetamido-2,4, 6-trideoxy-beta-L-altropyranose hydrolase n=1 Tax=Pseudomonas soli TaxID=1306993 RepID=UPI0028A6AB55|nr:UDP-2,4-diacetamido-2,4,6-trideoxy-beta-L-altropyranose hydrolase [Pseudomonas soli]
MYKVVLRADASLEMGTGHVMRCLTLADALRFKGAECLFICRVHAGNLNELIKSRGHSVYVLPLGTREPAEAGDLAHSVWLGATQQEDIQACRAVIESFQPDLLVVDHYALDSRWEHEFRKSSQKILVIDDLADRPHECDVLLDQTLGRAAEEYHPWTSSDCLLMCGSQYALLRPEFSELRSVSLARRDKPQLRHVLITMGGVDKDNATEQVLKALQVSDLPDDCMITVVMGSTAPWLASVRHQAKRMTWNTRVLVDVGDMAQLMVGSDLAIGAAGATSWERCCLGLPTIMMVLADNQRSIAHALEGAGAAWVVEVDTDVASLLPKYIKALTEHPDILAEMSLAAAGVSEGRGVKIVTQMLESSK